MLVEFFAASFYCRAIFLWREPVGLVDKHQSVWQNTRRNIHTKTELFRARIRHTKSIFGHDADYLSRHTKPMTTKKISQDSHRYGASSLAGLVAICFLWAEQAVSPWFGWSRKKFRVCLASPLPPFTRGSNGLEHKFRFAAKFRRHKIRPKT